MSAVSLSSGAEPRYFAQPYSLDAVGFSFTDLADYEAKAAKAVDRFGMPVEEFELQYIDGEHYRLFNALGVAQASLEPWFELLEELDDDGDRYLIACHLAENGYAVDDLSSRWDDYSVYHGTAADYARELVEDCYEVPGNLESYLDYERLGRDMVLEGSITELEYEILLVGG